MMQRFAIFLGLAVLAAAYPERHSKDHAWNEQESLKQFESTAFGKKYLANSEVSKQASLSDFRVYFYSRRNRDAPVVVINNDVEAIVNSGFFNSSARIISITHGWRNDYTSNVNTELTDAILDTHDVNVFVSDWGSIAHENYFTAEVATTVIGGYLGAFINKVVSTYDISHKQFTLIGHSLGAHVAGAAGSNADELVDFIIGLDAALYKVPHDPAHHLDPTDAHLVHAIHTCGGYLGFYDPIGHADYYPNGGENFQPGCNLDLLGTCSHGRSYEYLADSIITTKNKYWAFKCDTYDEFKLGKCFDKDTISYLGTLEPDRSAKGSYWLTTKSAAPFALDFDPFVE